jgi:hypothetical protein
VIKNPANQKKILWIWDCGGIGIHDRFKICCLIGMRVQVPPVSFKDKSNEYTM